MKKILVIVLVGILSVSSFSFAREGAKNNQSDNTRNARIYIGEIEPDLFLVAKWSKGYIPGEHKDPGTWITNHLTWYSDSYDVLTYYGQYVRNNNRKGKYRIEEFVKMKVTTDDNAKALSDIGYDVIENGVIIKDKIEIYDNETGQLLETIIIDGTEMAHPGLGNLKF